VDPRVAIPAAGLQQQHLDRRVFCKPIGQHAARRPRAYDDEVVMIRGHRSPQDSVSPYRFADDELELTARLAPPPLLREALV
jgi:hypothetical protein